MKRKLLLIACLLFLAGQNAFSQSTSKYGLPSPKDYDKWSVGLSFGQTFFFGDVLKDPDNNNNAFKEFEFAPGFGLQLTRQLSHSVGLRASGAYGTLLAGPNKERISKDLRITNAKLEGRSIEGALEGVYTFGNISHLKRNKKFHFYVSLGLGFFNFDNELSGKTDNPGQPVFDTLVSTGSITELMVPFSLGFKYQLGKIDIGLSYDYRKTFTDKVDLSVNSLSEYDNYAFARLHVNYTFGKKNKAMEWINPMEVVYNDIADLKDRVDLLSGDKDKDGVSDMFDKDNSSEEGIKVYGDGTSIDTDGDGIPDHKDSDPYSLRGAKVDANGAEIDTDGDGVPDSRDLEPNTPKGDLVNFQGTTIKSNDGKDGSDGAAFFPSVFFDNNSSQVKQSQKDRILTVVRALKQNPNMKITITGNTDRVGSESTNDKLGQRRADVIRDHMVKVYGVDAARLTTESKGKREPMADNSNKAMDRRVDFSVTK
jgi:OOP family OmpA-OmpF porin